MFLVPDTPPDIECYHDKGNVYAISWKVSLVSVHSLRERFIFILNLCWANCLLFLCLYVPFIKNDWIIITDTLQWTFWLRPVGHKRKRKMLKKNLWLFFNIFLLYLWPPGQCQKGLCRVLVIIVQSFFLSPGLLGHFQRTLFSQSSSIKCIQDPTKYLWWSVSRK